MKQFQPTDLRGPRIALNQKAILITSDGSQMDVVVTDISAGGFRIEAEETLYEGENIVTGEAVGIRVARGDDLRAEIVWAKGCAAGGVFLDVINLEGMA